MTKKERKLLGFLLVLLLIMGVIMGINFYLEDKARLIAKRDRLKSASEQAKLSEAMHEIRLEEKQWLEEHMIEPIEYNDAQTELDKYVSSLPKRFNLTEVNTELVKLDDVDQGKFRRVIIRSRVKGKEVDVYKWLNELNSPQAFRVVTSIDLIQDQKDESLLDCLVQVERYIIEIENP